MTDRGRVAQLREFVQYASRLKGDEKSEAQVFLDRLFRAFSRQGVAEAGATLEMRVKNDRGGTAFADLVWKPHVLIEMKKRGEDLSRHLQQAFDYWTQLVPGRPRYVVLCNFDEFRIYDFDQDINDPLDTVALGELPERYGPLNFLWPTNERAVFKVDREKVTREAADLLAAVYRDLKARKAVGAEKAQRFVLQCLVAFFSEDIGLLPKHFFTNLLDDCIDPPKAFDLLDGLFRAMNRREGGSGGRFKEVPYFNGGIFSESAAVELEPDNEVSKLKAAATYDWKHISPDIFGTIFQHSMEAEERHAFGAHYTAQTDIMKIVGPTIIAPFTRALEEADTLKEVTALRARLQSLRILDPACGSGNFLYVAYREMRRLEARIAARETELSRRQVTGQVVLGGVSPAQFFGLDIIPFAVELAKVTLSLAPKLAADELHTTENTLPLDNLDANIQCRDALINADGSQAAWPRADVIIGNPPFLDARKITMERGREYGKQLEDLYPLIARRADLCTYWFRKAHDHLPESTPADPFAGRAGLVGTQNIRNNEAREGGLDHIVKSGVIVEAVENQPWSGEANVHVSIANWVKRDEGADEAALLIPEQRRLWSKVEAREEELLEEPEGNGKKAKRPRTVTRGKRGKMRKDKSYELALREAAQINSALSDEMDVSGAVVLHTAQEPKRCFEGQQPGHVGFRITASERRDLLAHEPTASSLIRLYINGTALLTGSHQTTPEFIIDFENRDVLAAQQYLRTFTILRQRVLPKWEENARKESEQGVRSGEHQRRLETWWQLKRPREEMLSTIAPLSRYIACSRVTKRPIFAMLDPLVRPDSSLTVFAFDDDYSFGILQSNTHWQWFIAKCSKLTERFRYTPESVFDTFPWPQAPTDVQVRAVAEAGRAIRRVRDEHLPKIAGGLRALYRTLELPGKSPLRDAHAALDAAVMSAYGFDGRKDLLKQLLDLNLAVAGREDAGEAVTGPGVPTGYGGDRGALVTGDCIRP